MDLRDGKKTGAGEDMEVKKGTIKEIPEKEKMMSMLARILSMVEEDRARMKKYREENRKMLEEDGARMMKMLEEDGARMIKMLEEDREMMEKNMDMAVEEVRKVGSRLDNTEVELGQEIELVKVETDKEVIREEVIGRIDEIEKDQETVNIDNKIAEERSKGYYNGVTDIEVGGNLKIRSQVLLEKFKYDLVLDILWNCGFMNIKKKIYRRNRKRVRFKEEDSLRYSVWLDKEKRSRSIRKRVRFKKGDSSKRSLWLDKEKRNRSIWKHVKFKKGHVAIFKAARVQILGPGAVNSARKYNR
ncbi:unnamed protein product [Psylliodes chrysocephalus]|uniref:Uncharacterized protein n=1 Tax=Psylliodes chrysocephalus TaxID=3402493 RepID=A0A9P0CMM3_9CUCU|nr:unnamed protein product [Psylliodes chrysocephala]